MGAQKDGCYRWEEQKIDYDLSFRRFDAAEVIRILFSDRTSRKKALRVRKG